MRSWWFNKVVEVHKKEEAQVKNPSSGINTTEARPFQNPASQQSKSLPRKKV